MDNSYGTPAPLTDYAAADKPAVKQEAMFPERQRSRVVGILFDTYIVVEGGEEFFMIDQHAAHERVLYDELMRFDGHGAVQDLLLPYVFEVNHLEKAYLDDILPYFAELGFSIEPFGRNSYKIGTVPAVLADVPLGEFIKLALSDISQKRDVSAAKLLKDRLAQSACKAAVKGGDRLPEAELARLVSVIAEQRVMPVCPHGRPIAVKVTKTEVEKWFRRIVR
jgi:DNA mismatch repair protein MutL